MESLYAVSTGAQQRCSRDRGERALSFQDVVSLGIVQPIRDGAEHMHWLVYALYDCPTLPRSTPEPLWDPVPVRCDARDAP